MEVENLPAMSRGSLGDTKVLFRKVFGSEVFEDHVGQLVLLSSPPPEFDPSLLPKVQKPKLDEIMKTVRLEREQKLTEILKNRLQFYVEGNEDELVQWAREEAQRLSQAEFGAALLHTIGYIYSRKAAKELGKGKRYMKILFLREWIRDKRHKRKSRTAAASAAVSYIQVREEWKRCDGEEIKNEKAMKVAKDIQDTMLDSFWKMNVADIEMTLSHVCEGVLKDADASKDIRTLRAKAMKKIGTIFQDVKAR